MPPKARQGNATAKIGLLVALLIGATVFGLWWTSRSPVPLDNDQYAITLALYRVCNQRNADGLDELERLLDSSSAKSEGNAITSIRDVIREARDGDWEGATSGCRRLLDDQAPR
ncbi:MAG: hypothetical protein AAGJ40_22195 [Planctomycetota bacterium]